MQLLNLRNILPFCKHVAEHSRRNTFWANNGCMKTECHYRFLLQMQSPLQIGTVTSVDKAPCNGECCMLHWDVTRGRWAIRGFECNGGRVREMQSLPARREMEPYLKPASYAAVCRCSLWVSVHAPSTRRRLQTHQGGARQNQLGVAMLLLALLDSEKTKQGRR